MGDFADGVNILSRPIPGRPIKSDVVKENKIEQKDINAIADAVIKAISSKIPVMLSDRNTKEEFKDFDNSASLDKLAKAMIIGRDEKDSNLEGMGIVKETKKDERETKNTIDLLSKLRD